MTRLEYDRIELRIGDEVTIGIHELDLHCGDFYEGDSPFGVALGAVSATASVKLTRRSWKRFARALRHPLPLWWPIVSKMPRSGLRFVARKR